MVSVPEARSLRFRTGIIELIDESRDSVAHDDHSRPINDEDGSDAEYDPTQPDLEDILEDLDTYTQCLVDLSPSLACPAMDSTTRGEATINTTIQSREPHQYYADLIGTRFPEAAADIVEQLGRSNWERYKRVSAERTANLQAPHPGKEALDEVAASHFQDSGLGSSLPAQANYASSMTSYLSSSAGGDRPHVPALSDKAKRGIPFTCDACGKLIRVTNKRVWK